MAWTEERISVLKKLWENGLSASQIASELGEGVTRNAVIGKAHRLGLKSRPSPVKADKKKKVRPQPAKPKPQPKSDNMVGLLDLTERICKWPLGHPGDPDFHFCGEPSQPGLPYCTKHCLEAYQAAAPRKDRNR